MKFFYFWGADPNPGPTGSTPTERGIKSCNLTNSVKQKLLIRVGLYG